MNKKTNKPGYILILAFMILSISLILVTQFYRRGTMHMYFDYAIIAREKAKVLALSGVQLALSQLYVEPEKKGNDKKDVTNKKGGKQQDPNIIFMQKVFPILNQWQTIDLQKDRDGMDGKIKLCIISEDGKININKLFDFEKGSFAAKMKKGVDYLFAQFKNIVNAKNLQKSLQVYLKKRKRPLDDVTQLLEIKEFAQAFKAKVFPTPLVDEKKKKRPVFLTDVFTVWSDSYQMQPWFLSDSVAALLKLNRTASGDKKKRSDIIKSLGKKPLFEGDINQIWKNLLQPLYKKSFNAIAKEVQNLFSSNFSANAFSVVSYGIVRNIEQKVLAIVQKKLDGSNTYFVKKLYWI